MTPMNWIVDALALTVGVLVGLMFATVRQSRHLDRQVADFQRQLARMAALSRLSTPPSNVRVYQRADDTGHTPGYL